MVEIDGKDDFLLTNEVLLSRNVIFVYKGKYPKIYRKFSKILKRVFSITHAFLSKMLLNRPPIIDPLFGGV